MANNLSGEVATPDHLGCTPALPVIKHRGLYLPSLPFGSSTSPAPCGPMVERRRLGLDPSKLLGIQIVIGTNRFAKDGKSHNYVKIWQKLCERTKGLRQKVWTRTKIMSPYIRYFVAIYRDLSRFTHFLEDSVQKRAFLGQEVPFYMVYNI